MTQVMEQPNPYLSDFERLERQPAAPALQRLRKAAIARFAELGFPGPRDEGGASRRWPRWCRRRSAWRRRTESRPRSAAFLAGRRDRVRTGRSAEEIPAARRAAPGRHADFKRNAFAALNTAFLRDGAFVHVPANCAVEAPIHLSPLSPRSTARRRYVWHRRALVVLGRNARATVIEDFSGPPTTYFTNAVTEIVVGENAELDHYKVQEEGPEAYHMAVTQVQLGRAARFASHAFTLGGPGRATRSTPSSPARAANAPSTASTAATAAGSSTTTRSSTTPCRAAPAMSCTRASSTARARRLQRQDLRPPGRPEDRRQADEQDAFAVRRGDHQRQAAAGDLRRRREMHARRHGRPARRRGGLLPPVARRRTARGARLLIYAFANDVVGRVKVESLRARLEDGGPVGGHGTERGEVMSIPAIPDVLPERPAVRRPRPVFNVQRVREDFPILRQKVRGKPWSTSTTPRPRRSRGRFWTRCSTTTPPTTPTSTAPSTCSASAPPRNTRTRASRCRASSARPTARDHLRARDHRGHQFVAQTYGRKKYAEATKC